MFKKVTRSFRNSDSLDYVLLNEECDSQPSTSTALIPPSNQRSTTFVPPPNYGSFMPFFPFIRNPFSFPTNQVKYVGRRKWKVRRIVGLRTPEFWEEY